MSSENGIPAENLAYRRCESCGVELIRHSGLIGTCAELQKANARIKELESMLKQG